MSTHVEKNPSYRPVWVGVAVLATLAGAACAYAALAPRQRFRTVAGSAGSLVIDDGGEGDVPVLFVHSFAGSTAHWNAQLTHLRRNRRAVAMDLRGNGMSDPPRDNDYAMTALADDIAAVADGLELDRFVLVGHSMGGDAAAAYTAQHPERVAGLLLVGTPAKASDDLAQQVMSSLDADYDSVMNDYWETLLKGARPVAHASLSKAMRKVRHEASKAMIAATFAYDPVPALTSYPGPVHLIDTVHTDGPASLHLQARHVPRDLVTGTSHWPQLDEPDEFNQLLDGFLQLVK
ncbi:MAG: alpha/beta hydrolase [Rhizobacter sp.]